MIAVKNGILIVNFMFHLCGTWSKIKINWGGSNRKTGGTITGSADDLKQRSKTKIKLRTFILLNLA